MDFKTKKRDIDSLEVHVTEMDAFAAQDLGLLLAQECLDTVGGLGAFFSGGLEGFARSQEDVSTFVTAVVAGMRKLNGKKLRELQMQILATTQVVVDGKIITLDSVNNAKEVFGPRLGLLWEVVAFAIEVLYADFIESLRSWASAAMKKVEALKEKAEKLRAKEKPATASPSSSRLS